MYYSIDTSAKTFNVGFNREAGMARLNVNKDIIAKNGNIINVVELDAQGKILKAGNATVVAK